MSRQLGRRGDDGRAGARFKVGTRTEKSWTGEVVINQAVASRRFEFTTLAGRSSSPPGATTSSPPTGLHPDRDVGRHATWNPGSPGAGQDHHQRRRSRAFTKASIETTLANIKKSAEDPDQGW